MVGHAFGDRPANLPNLVHRLRVRRQSQRGEDPHHAVGMFRAGVRDVVRDLGFDNRAVGADVVGVDDHGTVVRLLEGEEGLGARHPRAGWVDGPGNPTVGFGGRGDVGDGEGGGGGSVGPVEEGVEVRQVCAVGVLLVVFEGL